MNRQCVQRFGDGVRPADAAVAAAPRSKRWPLVVAVLVALAVGGVVVERFTRPKEPSEDLGPDGRDAEGSPALAPMVGMVDPGPLSVEGLVAEARWIASGLTESFANDPAALGLAGRIYQRFGSATKAMELWQRCLQIDPRSAQACFCIGSVAWERGDYVTAIDWMKKTLSIDPGQVNAYAFLAESLVNIGRGAEALALLDKAPQAARQSPQALFVFGQAALQAGDYDRARRQFEAALAIDPKSANAHYGLSQALTRLGQAENAQSHREECQKLKAATRGHEAGRRSLPPDLELKEKRQIVAAFCMEAGRVYYAHAAAEPAETLWLRGAAVDPENPGYREFLARYYVDRGQPEKAAALLRARAAEPSDAGAAERSGGLERPPDGSKTGTRGLHERRETSGRGGDTVGRTAPSVVAAPLNMSAEDLKAEAIAVTQRLKAAYPLSPQPLAVAALMYNELRNTKQATRCWEECLRLDPKFADAYEGLGVIALKKGEFEEAVRILRRAVEVNPRLCGAYARLADGLMNLGRPHEAAAVLESGLKTCPPDSERPFFLGQAYLQLKEYEKAKNQYQAAIRADPACTYAYYGLAAACEHLGRKQESEAHRAAFQRMKQQDQKAEKDRLQAYDDAAHLRNAVASVYTNAGIIHRRHGDMKQAEEHWLRSVTLDPAGTTARGELAVMYQQQERFADALEMFEQLARLEPRRAVFPLNIGITNARLNRFEAAEKAFRKAVEIAPKRPEGYLALADFYLRSEQKAEEAKALATNAVRLAPTATGFAILTAACEATGDRAGAQAAIEKAIRMEPQNQKYRAMQRAIQDGH